MVRRASFCRMSAVVAALMLLAACGGAPAPAQNADVPATQAPVAQATAAPAATLAPTLAPEPNTETSPAKGDGEENPYGDGAVQSGEGAAETSGQYVADLGFRPENDGFSFPNYGGENGAVNLTPSDLWRMFGDQACAAIEGDGCILTPAGQQWMEQINQAMDGGHCEGMAVLSNLFYTGQVPVADFGADTVPALQIEGNEPLQREIAYWWSTQATQPARAGIVEQTPSGVVNTLLTAFAAGPEGSDQYAVGIYKRDRSGGHAVTPYAVEDRGEGIYWIMVYDNNYPGIPRAIEVDTNADTWRYTGSTNPAEAEDEYEGDASTITLELAPILPRLEQQFCPFCDEAAVAGRGGAGLAQPEQPMYNEVWLEGDADLLITDAEGHSIGFKDGKFVNEIPGAASNANKFGVSVWDENAEPVYYVPTDVDFSISLDGSRLTEPTTSTVTLIGPGYALEVSDIVLEPGQIDVLDVAPDGSLLSYRTEKEEKPFMLVAIETDASDYLFGVQGLDMTAGEAVNLSLDTKEGWLSVDSIDNSEDAVYGLVVAKYDEQGEQIFGADDITLAPDDVIYVDYLKWPGNGQPMELDVDKGGDGTVDESIQVNDVTDQFAEE